MKNESTFGYVLRLTVILLLICAAVAAVLACVNSITKEPIAAIQEQKTQTAIAEVLPEAGSVEKLQLTGDTGIVNAVYASESGYAVEVVPNGFNGKVTMMVGIVDGKVTGISIISHAETPGLGAVAAAQNAKGEAFRGQFVGQSGQLSIGSEIDAMSGATITSKAVAEGVSAALAYVEKLGYRRTGL